MYGAIVAGNQHNNYDAVDDSALCRACIKRRATHRSFTQSNSRPDVLCRTTLLCALLTMVESRWIPQLINGVDICIVFTRNMDPPDNYQTAYNSKTKILKVDLNRLIRDLKINNILCDILLIKS